MIFHHHPEGKTMSKIETFTLQKERCKLAHLNLRSELHGEEHANAIDLKFEFDSANNVLAKLHPDLRATYYKKDDNRELIESDHLPALRFPLLDPVVKWKVEIPRTLLRLHTDSGDVVLAGGKTNNFQLTLKEGGTVSWHFRVQFSKPDPAAIAALSGLLQTVVPVTLECRDEDDEGTVDLFDQVEQQTQQPMSAARQQAEEMFGAAGTAGTAVDTLPATLAGDPDFLEVKGAAQADDVVDAEFVAGDGAAAPAADPIPLKTDDTPAASNVEPIGKPRRGGKRAAGGGSNLE
jgi:hypothetical protein